MGRLAYVAGRPAQAVVDGFAEAALRDGGHRDGAGPGAVCGAQHGQILNLGLAHAGGSSIADPIPVVLDLLEQIKPRGETQLVPILHELAETIRQRALIVIISDFFVEPEPLRSCFEHLRFRKHDVAAFHLLDPLELSFTFRRPMRFLDMEGGPAIVAEPSEIADRLVTHPLVELVTFTGGVAIGKQIAERAGYRRCVLELGGNDPLIVADDADVERAAALAVQGSYRNSGQRCTAVKRMLVDKRIAASFTECVVELTRAWTYGDPFDESNRMGTVIDEPAARSFEARVNEAQALGARVLAGHRRDGALYAPTVVDRVDPSMRLVRDETFGPVSPIIAFDTIDEAIALANGTAFGLSSGVCTNRQDLIARFVNELHVGTVNVWEVPGYRIELTPFGGIKDSGLGYKEGVQEAMKSFTNLKTFSLPWE